MRVIYNRFIPLRGFLAINLFGLVFVRRQAGTLSPVTANHEYIHTLQQRELLYLFFYPLYVLEWLFWLLILRHPHRAYVRISFEREAYAHQSDLHYAARRRHFACWRKDGSMSS